MDVLTGHAPAPRLVDPNRQASSATRAGAVGILAQRLHGRVTGVGRYIGNLLAEWSAGLARHEFPFDRIVLLSREPLRGYTDRPGIENRWQRSALPEAVWEQVHVPRMARGLAVLFCPSYSGPLLVGCPMVVGTLDMLQATRSRDFPLVARIVRGPLYRFSARRADAVITLADATVGEIVERYGIESTRVHAIPLAADPGFTHAAGERDGDVLRRYRLDDAPFVLHVGKLAVRRHIPELMAGFTQAVGQHALPHRLVLAGPDPQRMFTASGNERHRYLGHVPDADLPALYRRADLVAYLSEDEGFGLPIVEAMHSGTPVLTMNRPVLREVAGTAAEYLEHATVDAIAEALSTLLRTRDRRDSLAASGLERAASFSWARTAQRTLDVLTGVATARASRS